MNLKLNDNLIRIFTLGFPKVARSPEFLCSIQKFRNSEHIVGQISQPDFSRGSNMSKCLAKSNDRHFQLNAKDVFNPCANPGPRFVPPPFPTGQLPAAVVFFMNLVSKTIFGKHSTVFPRPVSRVCVNIFAAIFRIQQWFKNISIMDQAISYFIRTNQFVFNVDTNIILVWTRDIF